MITGVPRPAVVDAVDRLLSLVTLVWDSDISVGELDEAFMLAIDAGGERLALVFAMLNMAVKRVEKEKP